MNNLENDQPLNLISNKLLNLVVHKITEVNTFDTDRR
jgi:hypothetical protein